MRARCEARQHDDAFARPFDELHRRGIHHAIFDDQHARITVATEDGAARDGDRLRAALDDEIDVGGQTGAQIGNFLVESQAHFRAAGTRVDLRRDVVQRRGRWRTAPGDEHVRFLSDANFGEELLVDVRFDLDVGERREFVDDGRGTDHLTAIDRSREHHAVDGRDDGVVAQARARLTTRGVERLQREPRLIELELGGVEFFGGGDAALTQLLQAREIALGFGDGTLLQRDLRGDFVDRSPRRIRLELHQHLAGFDGLAFFLDETDHLARRLRHDGHGDLGPGASGDGEHALGRALPRLGDADRRRLRGFHVPPRREGDGEHAEEGITVAAQPAARFRCVECHVRYVPVGEKRFAYRISTGLN